MRARGLLEKHSPVLVILDRRLPDADGLELCQEIRRHIPQFVFFEAPIGEDPDKRDYIVSNERILSTGFRPDWSLERGIRELAKCYTIVTGTGYGNV